MAAPKRPRASVRGPSPTAATPPDGVDPRAADAFIRGDGPTAASPPSAAERSRAPSGPGSRDGSRAVKRWSNGDEARKHSIYLPPLLSEDLLRASREDGVKVSKLVEQAVDAWLDARAKRR